MGTNVAIPEISLTTWDFSSVRLLTLLHGVQTDSEAHPAPYPMGTGGSFPGVQRPGREASHSPPSSAEVKKGGDIPPLPNISSWDIAYLIKHRDNFTF
jgi:hypothetical protein